MLFAIYYLNLALSDEDRYTCKSINRLYLSKIKIIHKSFTSGFNVDQERRLPAAA